MNKELSSYPAIDNKNFEKLIASKKEFYDYRMISKTGNSDSKLTYKDLYCLEPQQKFLSNFINPLTNYNSILVYHSVGVGKTLTGISIAETFKEYYKIVVLLKNKNLKYNFWKELTGICSNYFDTKQEYSVYHNKSHPDYQEIKSRIDRKINKHYTFYTYGEITNPNRKVNLSNTVLIVDEIHNVTGNDIYKSLIGLMRNALNIKTVLLSATPVADNIQEIFEIANLLGDTLPIRNDLVKSKLINNTHVPTLTAKGKKMILNSLRGKVSYLTADPSFFPERIYRGTKGIRGTQGTKLTDSKLTLFTSKMSAFQENIYKNTLNENDVFFNTSSNVLTMVYPDGSYGKAGYVKYITKNQDRSFLKLENITKYSCKLHAILQAIQKSPGPVFIYSSLVNNGGTSLLKEVLLANGYATFNRYQNDKHQFIVLDDNLSDVRKQNLMYTFNNKNNSTGKKIKVIIGSPVVSEGFTFKNIRQIHILEPFWNLSRIEQVIGRGVRFNSHKALPENQRTTEIYLHAAVSTTDTTDTIDTIKYKLSEDKDLVIKDLEYDIKRTAVDCSLNKPRNELSNKFDYTRECQYKPCAYTCTYNGGVKKIDKSTYDLKKHSIEEYKFILKCIIELYNIGYVYNLDYIVKYILTKYSVSKKNIYYVLDEVINKPVYIRNEYILVPYGEYYVLSQENSESEDLFDRMFPIKDKYTRNLNEVLNKKDNHKETSTVGNSFIYGTYFNKVNVKDNTFRIFNKVQNSLKACANYSLDELADIAKKLNVNLKNTQGKLSKKMYCNAIEKDLVIKKRILTRR